MVAFFVDLTLALLLTYLWRLVVSPDEDLMPPTSFWLGLFAIIFLYFFGSNMSGASPGKRLLRLRIVGPAGERPALGTALARSLVAMLGVFSAAPALFDSKHRALHDRAARTRVVGRA